MIYHSKNASAGDNSVDTSQAETKASQLLNRTAAAKYWPDSQPPQQTCTDHSNLCTGC